MISVPVATACRWVLVGLIALAGVVAGAGGAWADAVTFADGRSEPHAYVRDITTSPIPEIEIAVYTSDNPAPPDWQSFPLGEIERIVFRERRPDGTTIQGRVAHLRTADGSIVPNVLVDELRRGADGVFLRLYRSGSRSHGEAIIVTQAQVTLLEFAPPPLHVQSGEVEEGRTLTGRDYVRPEGAAERAPRLGNSPAPPASEDVFGIRAVYGDNVPTDEPEDSSGDFLTGALGGMAMAGLGWAVLGIIVVALMGVTFIIGTFVLLFTARNEGIGDLTVPRALIASLLLSTVPFSLFIGIMMIPFPLCSVKLVGGIFAFWFSSRMIVMGMLEVMEEKATDVLISYYLVFLLLAVGIGIYFQVTM